MTGRNPFGAAVVAVGILAGVVATAGCGGADAADPADRADDAAVDPATPVTTTVAAPGDLVSTTVPPTTPATAAPQDDPGEAVVSVFALSVGDCFDDPEEEQQVAAVDLVPCDVPHDSEAYALFDLTGDAYPGEEAVRSLAQAGCIERFAAYVGAPYETSALDVAFLYPLEREWRDLTDRGVTCFAFRVDGEPLVASVAGSGL